MIRFITLGLLAGAALGVQVAMNSQLGRSLASAAWGAFASMLVGACGIALAIALLREPVPAMKLLPAVPAWAWAGGALGAAYVLGSVWLTPRLGASLFVALTVAGQLLAAIALDHFGALGLDRQPLSLSRALGAVLVVAGVVLARG